MPTIEELASLVEREKINGVHINGFFDTKQTICWSSDDGPLYYQSHWTPPQVWHVNFSEGVIGLSKTGAAKNRRAFRRGLYSLVREHYVRAVRSLR